MMKRYACAALAAGVLSYSAAPAWPQESGGPLPRRAALGVTLAVDAAGAVVVSAVTAGSAGALAGVAPGDAIAALDGTPVSPNLASQLATLCRPSAAKRGGNTKKG